MLAILKREFKSYFQTVIGWLFIAVSVCIYGLYYYLYNFLNGYTDVAHSVSAVSFICLITIPVLSMRCLADEKRTRTDQLILTSPVTVGKLVLGKFLAIGAVFSITILVYAVSPLILCAFGTVSLKISYVAILGYWLFGLSCIAICVFISSITESQVIAAVLSFLALFAGYMMAGVCNMISSTGNIFTTILKCYDLSSPMDDFINGCINVTGIVYYLSVIGIFLFFTVQSIQKRRWSITKSSVKTGAFSTVFIAVTVALVVVVNFVVAEVPTTYTSIDVTSQKLYSITDASYEMLDGLNEDVTIYVLAKESTADETLNQTLKRYEDGSKHVTVEYKDPSVSPNFYTTYTDDAPSAGSLIVVSDKRSTVVDYGDVYQSTMDYTTYTSMPTGYDGEGLVTSAIEYVTSDNMPKVYILEGHNEGTLESDFTAAIDKANITTETINLLQYDAIPEDAAGIIINGPTTDFSEDDAKKVKDYLAGGGKALIVAAYTTEDMKNFKSVLSEYQVSLADGMVAEGDTSSYYQIPFYLLPAIGTSDLTSNCTSSYIFAPYSLGMTYPEELNDDTLTITDLLTTSDASYSKTDVENAESYDKEKGDIDGPFKIGLDIVKKISGDTADSTDETTTDSATSSDGTEAAEETVETELIVFSSNMLFTDQVDQQVSGNNMTLFTSCLNRFKSDDTTNSVIPVKSYDLSKLTITASVSILAGLLCIIVIPLFLLIFGIVVWVRRRKR